MHSQNTQKKKDGCMYRSNSSLELMYTDQPSQHGTLRREYGSHGSIDVIGGPSVPPKLTQQITCKRNTVHTNQSSSISNFTRAVSLKTNESIISSERVDGPVHKIGHASPKLKLKFHKFWGGNNGHNISKTAVDDSCDNFSRLGLDSDEKRRRGFTHYDCQSLLANLGCAARVHGLLLGRRRNTATGASAASLARNAADAVPTPLTDIGDNVHNDLVECCPFFRNEVGGEDERCVSLSSRSFQVKQPSKSTQDSYGWHRPITAYGLSILEFPAGQTPWKHHQVCPFAPKSPGQLPIEIQDQGAGYYRHFFYGQEHQNWFGLDDQLGPVAVSIKKERAELPVASSDTRKSQNPMCGGLVWQYRIIVRTSELLTLRGSVLEEAIPSIKPTNNSKNYNAKDVIEHVAPEVPLACLRLGVDAEDQLLRLDEQGLTRQYKVGVMFCRANQSTEEEMYNNEESGPAFEEFLQSIGQKVRLKNFMHYRAGLDNKTDSTGKYSVYAVHRECELMFHVSTYLPYTQNNRQQLLRKRHIGNDIVTIVFQEPGARPFTPKNIRSQFQHVFIVVRAVDPCTENTHYSISVSRSKEVPIFGPPIKEGAMYPKGDIFTDLLLSKIINGENAAIQSTKFSTMATRTRQEYLKDLANNYVTATPLDTGQKFSLFSLMKSGSSSSCTSGLNSFTIVRGGGAAVWPCGVRDEAVAGIAVAARLGLAPLVVLAMEDATKQPLFAIPTPLILGWVYTNGNISVYYHCGECVTLRPYCDVDSREILARLQDVAPHAGPLPEILIVRPPSGQLGFHVRYDGVVTGVEAGGAGARAGLAAGARLLEVCRAAVASLGAHHLADLLLAAEPVTLRAASGMACACERGNGGASSVRRPRDLSPPRSSDSSGYGTGGSGRSAARASVARRTPGTRPLSGVGSLQDELMRLIDPDALNGCGSSRSASSRPESMHLDPTITRFDSNPPRLDASPRSRIAENSPNARSGEMSPHSRVGELSPHSRGGDLSPHTRGGNMSPRTGPRGEELNSPRRVDLNRRTADIALRQSEPNVADVARTRDDEIRGSDGLPLPSSLDWPALVHTATAAMMQLCEEQSVSLDTSGSSTLSGHDDAATDAHGNWSETPQSDTAALSRCGCGLGARVAALEAERHAMDAEVRRLRRHNARLRDESARAVRQLKRFTHWFSNTVRDP